MFKRLSSFFRSFFKNEAVKEVVKEDLEEEFTLEFEDDPLSNIQREVLTIKMEVDKFKENFDFSFYKPNVGVFGVNSAGKSTFLNALLGSKEFKMGLSETTSEITRLTNKELKKIPNVKDEIRDYENLKYFNLFDIPGFGKYFDEEVLKEILSYLDIVFWIVDISKGVTKSDKEFLKFLKDSDKRVMVVTNKIDTILEDELEGGYEAIEKNISAIYSFFEKEGLSKNLIGVLPISAKKALIGKLKDKNKEFSLLMEYIENLLIYSVFIESFTTSSYLILQYLNSDEFIKELESLLPTYDFIEDLSYGLYYEVYNNVSFVDSFLSGKGQKARPIVNKYIAKFQEYIHNSYNQFEQYFNDLTFEILNHLYIYNVLVSNHKLSFDIKFKRKNPTLKIPVEQVSSRCFLGSSFAEELRDEFFSNALNSFEKANNALIDEINRHISLIREELIKAIDEFQKHLNLELENKVKTYQNLVKEFVVKEV